MNYETMPHLITSVVLSSDFTSEIEKSNDLDVFKPGVRYLDQKADQLDSATRAEVLYVAMYSTSREE
jgi:hypothetical protein